MNESELLKNLSITFSKASQLPLDIIDPTKKLKTYGMDSVTIFEFRTEIKERYAIDLPASLISENPSLQEVADYIIKMKQGN